MDTIKHLLLQFVTSDQGWHWAGNAFGLLLTWVAGTHMAGGVKGWLHGKVWEALVAASHQIENDVVTCHKIPESLWWRIHREIYPGD